MSNLFDIDLSATTTLKQTRKSKYDLRYSTTQERFNFSDSAFNRMDLENHAVEIRRSNDGKYILLTSVDDSTFEEQSSGQIMARRFYKEGERAGQPMGKGNFFTSGTLREQLVSLFGKDVTEYRIVAVGEDPDGDDVFVVQPAEENDTGDTPEQPAEDEVTEDSFDENVNEPDVVEDFDSVLEDLS